MKIFGIGLSRTGTKSLCRALAILGYRAGHYAESLDVLRLVDGQLLLDCDAIRRWDALTDIPIAAFYRDLDAGWPGSKFILTVREPGAWLESCERHYRASAARVSRVPGARRERILAVRRRVFGREDFEPARFLAASDVHTADVRRHFSGRPRDLLVMDICGGAGWTELCAFLSRPVPAAAFPWENAR